MTFYSAGCDYHSRLCRPGSERCNVIPTLPPDTRILSSGWVHNLFYSPSKGWIAGGQNADAYYALVPQLENFEPLWVACGDNHTALITTNNELYIFSGSPDPEPKKVNNIKPVYYCSLRIDALVVLPLDNGLYFFRNWGSSPQLFLENTKIIDCAASESNFLALSIDHKVYVWGNSFTESPKEITIPSSSPITRVFAGSHHLFVLDQENQLFAYGRNDDGQCGLGNTLNCHTFQLVPKFTNSKIVFVGGGHYISYCLDKEGSIFSTGKGEYNALMQNDSRSLKQFKKCACGPPEPADMIAVGCYHIIIGCKMTYPIRHPLDDNLIYLPNKKLHLHE